MTRPAIDTTRLDLRPLEVRLAVEPEPDTMVLPRVAPPGHPGRTSSSLVELRATPARTPGGCRTKVDGQRCGHLATQHRDVGHQGWRVRCSCGCTVYRDPWPIAIANVGLGIVLGVVAGLGILVLLYALLTGGWS